MINCPTCEKFDGHGCKLFGRQPSMAVCPYAVERKPRNHFEEIKAMRMEEMAEFLRKNRGGCRALTTESYVCDFYTDDLHTDCNACWLDWLKEEIADA